MKKQIHNNPQSYDLFKRKFIFALDKANKSENTIFTESIDIDNISDSIILEHYSYFNQNYRDMYDMVKDTSEKIKVINQSINESYFQNNFNIVLDTILESGSISISTEYILENTVDSLNLDLEKIGQRFLKDSNSKVETIEENVFGVAGGVIASGLGASAGGILLASGVVALAAAFFMPAREANQIDMGLKKYTGNIMAAILGAGNIFNTGFTPNLARSHENMIKFDNIDADPSVKSLFNRIQKVGLNVKEARNGLETVIAECLANNKNILTMDPNQSENIKNILSNPFTNAQSYNILKLIWKSIFGDADANKDSYGTLLRFRKCLSNKLVDIYKLLLISNLENNRDHKRIIDSIVKSNNNPERILSFLPNDTDEDNRLKEAILALIQFRIYLTELANNLEKGFFDVDREAGKYLKQKLSTVDSEVENYLRLNNNKYRNTFEGNLMDRKPVNAKRDLLSLRSNL